MEIFTNKQRKRFPLQKINSNDWIFEIRKCKCNCAWDLEEWNEIMYIWAKKDDNWFMKIVKKEEKLITKWNCIIFICDWEWSVWYSNYIDKDFIWSTTLSVWYNEHLNNNIWIFLVTLLDLERKKYSYWRKYGTNLSKTKIKLPIDSNWNPDRKFMENYIKSLDYKPITTKNKAWKNNLNINKWKEFKVGDLFNIWWSKTTPKEVLEDIWDWIYPYVTTSATNNWIEWFYNFYTENGNIIVVESACMWFSTYQSENFSASDHVELLKPKYHFNKYIWLFITTLINNENFRYSYWRKCNQIKIKNMIIKLPVDKNLEPDREFMENYIKNLPYWDRI